MRDKRLRENWIKALRENKYPQCKNATKAVIDEKDHYDVCGVLLEELRLLYPSKYKWVRTERKLDKSYVWYLVDSKTMFPVIPNIDLGVHLGNITAYNDLNWSFPELAAYIERNQK